MSALCLSNSFVLNANGLYSHTVMLQRAANMSEGKHCSTVSEQTRNDYQSNGFLTSTILQNTAQSRAATPPFPLQMNAGSVF